MALCTMLLIGPILALVTACEGNDQQQASKPRPLPEFDQTLRPGEYRSEEFEASVSFRVGEGWSSVTPELSDFLGITRGKARGGLTFVNPKEVLEHTPAGYPKEVDAPEDMVGWFRRHPYLKTSVPERLTVGGVEGKQFDVELGDVPKDIYDECGTDCVTVLRFSDGTLLTVYRNQKWRMTVLEDVEGERVLILFWGPDAKFDEHTVEAQKVIDTVEWRGS